MNKTITAALTAGVILGGSLAGVGTAVVDHQDKQEAAALQAQVETLTAGRDDLGARLESTSATLDETIEERDGLASKVGKIRAERNDAREKVRKVKKQRDEAREQRDVARAEAGDLRESLEAQTDYSAELQLKVNDLTADLEWVKGERDDALLQADTFADDIGWLWANPVEKWFEDGSYVRYDGKTGCAPSALCND